MALFRNMRTVAAAEALLLLLLSSAAVGQPSPAPDAATMQKVIAVLQAQRNQLADALTNAEVRVLALTEEVEKLKARVRELEDQKK